MNENLNTTGSFLSKNYKTILFVILGIITLYWVIFVVTPTVTMSQKEKQQIDSLNNVIKDLYQHQSKLDSTILDLNKEIDQVDNDIDKIKNKKTIVKKEYHEKINRVDTYTEPELDSFFSDRYK